ncbi:MAG: MFS transporter [Verrucomicrobiota bacterium]
MKFHHFVTYGSASTGKVAIEMMLQLYLFDFFTRLLGLSPALAGTAFAIAILWDAISDLVVSVCLFKARQKGVLYTSFVLGGGVILGGSIAYLFSANAAQSELSLFLHLLIAYSLVNTGMTLIDLPQTSMSAELSHKSDERNKLLASRLGLGILGLIIGSTIPGFFLGGESIEAAARSRTIGGYVLAAMVVFASIITFIGLRKVDHASAAGRQVELPSFREALAVLKEKFFRRIMTASIIAAIGRTVNAALALLYYRLVLNLSEEDVTRIIFPIFTLCIVLSIPLWVKLSKRYGKARPAWVSVGLLGIMGIIAYPLLPAGQIWPPILISAFGGVLCGSVFLVDSMITDLIDQDEAKTGKRKESLFFALQKSGVKIARAVAFVVIGGALQISGVEMGLTETTTADKLFVVLLFGVAVGLCFVACAYFLRRTEACFPISKNKNKPSTKSWMTMKPKYSESTASD